MSVKQEQPIANYDQVVNGEVGLTTVAAQLPNVRVAPGYVFIKANPGNVGVVYVGGAGVTVADKVTDTTSGLPLAAGDVTPPILVENLNLLYAVAATNGDAISYLILK